MRCIGKPLTRDEVVAFVAAARACVGVRWLHQGRDRRGVDCGGLVVVCLRAIGRDPYDPRGYGRLPYRSSLEKTLRRNYGPPVTDALRMGDVAMFAAGNAAPNHVGIIADYVHGGLSLIHAYLPNREVVEQPLDADWRAKLVEVYR